MKTYINPDETVTVIDANGTQTVALSSYAALLQEANRLGVSLNNTLSGLGHAVLTAGGNPGLIVTWSGRSVTMRYAGPQSFERFDVWVDGTSVDNAFSLTYTSTLPLLPASESICRFGPAVPEKFRPDTEPTFRTAPLMPAPWPCTVFVPPPMFSTP